MERTRGAQSEIGMIYQYAITALTASLLSTNESVKEYIVYSSVKGARKFDDIVARVRLKDPDEWFLTLIQVKHKINTKLKLTDVLKGKRIEYDISEYINSFNEIMDGAKLPCCENVRNDNIRFCIFCNQSIQTPVFLRGECTFQVNLKGTSICDPITKVLLPFGNKSWKFQCQDLVNSEYQRFFDGCHLHLGQDNYFQINKRIEGTCGIDNANEIVNYVKDYFNNNFLFKQGLHKQVFEIELQKIRLSKFVLPPPKLVDLVDDSRVAIWNEITLRHDITIVDKANYVDIEGCLYACLAKGLNVLLDTHINWNEIVDKQKNLDKNVIDKFVKYSKTKTLRYWISPPNTLNSLILELWKLGGLALILRTDIKLNHFERYRYLERSYVIIRDIEERFDEVCNEKLKIFSHVGNIKDWELQDRMLKNTIVSLQGRKKTTLKSLLIEDTELLATFSSVDIIGLMRKRVAYLKEDCLNGTNHLAFIIENRQSPATVDFVEPFLIGDNFTLECQPSEVEEWVTTVEKSHSYRNYTIYCLRKVGQHLQLLKGEKEKLSKYFIDQFGDPVYVCGGSAPIPIIGCVIPLNETNYVPRYLRRVTISKDYLNLKSKAVVLLFGDVQTIPHLQFTEIKDTSNVEREITEEKRYFIKVDAEEREDYWNKFSCTVLDVIVRDGKMELIRYKGCRELVSSISFNGKRFSESKFFDEIGKTAVTVVTGEPGLGKTSVLKSLCNNYSGNSYVLIYDLIYFQKFLRWNRNLLAKPIENVFAKFHSGKVHAFNNFLCALREKRKIILVLDAFDEIFTDFKEQVLEFIRAVTCAEVQIIISSRLKDCYLLMDKLNASVVKLDPLNTSDKEYLTNWKLNDDALMNLPMEFTTNPLHLNFLQIISESGESLASITRFDLYKKVVNMKIEHRLQRIMKTSYESSMEEIITLFEKLALVVMFGKKQIEEALRWRCDVKSFDCIKFDIVIRVDDDYPAFSHFAFVEFLIAQWLVKAIQTDIYRSIARHIYTQLMDKGKMYVLDILSEHLDIHKAVLDQNISKIVRICELGPPDTFKDVDKLGRTALHLATICCSRTNNIFDILHVVIQFMWSCGLDVYQRDAIMEWDWTDYVNFDIFKEMAYGNSKLTVELYLDREVWRLEKCKCTLLPFPIPANYFNCFFTYAVQKASFSIVHNLFLLQNSRNREFCNLYKTCTELTLTTEICHEFEINTCAGLTALHIACIYGREPVVLHLIELATSVDITDEFGYTPLLYSVMRCILSSETVKSNEAVKPETKIKTKAVIEMLLAKGANVDVRGKCGIAPLHIAARGKEKELIRFLLVNGANINIRNLHSSTPLHIAVDEGEEEIVRLLLENGANIYVQDQHGCTPLHVAVNGKWKEITRVLVEEGANVNAQDENGYAPLHMAVHMKVMEIIQLLLENGADINIQNGKSYTPLHTAADERGVEIIRTLLQKGADINRQSKAGWTPLHMAAHRKSEDITRILLEEGADVNIQNKVGLMALHIAADEGGEGVIRVFLEKNVNVDIQSKNGSTPLHIAARREAEEVIRVLLEKGANLNIQDADGLTPLHVAMVINSKEIIRILLERDGDLNIRDGSGSTLLHTAVVRNNKEIVRELLEKDANVNIQDKYGFTPLRIAVDKGEKDIIQILLEEGADVNISDNIDYTPLHIAVIQNEKEIIQALLVKDAHVDIQNNNGFTPLHTAVYRELEEASNMLLEADCNVNIQDKCGSTPLHIAVDSNAKKIIQILLNNGAWVNIQDKSGSTPIHIAAFEKKTKIVHWLLSRCDNINIQNKNGSTALHIATRKRAEKIMQILLEKGADVESQEKDGCTPLHIATSKAWNDIMRLLLVNGANVDIQNKAGSTPLHIATFKNAYKTIRLLLDKGANVNIQDERGFTPLHIATFNEGSAIINLLLAKGAEIDIQDKDSCTPLHIAASGKSSGTVRSLLEKGASISVQDKDGSTPLHIAARREIEKIIEMLLKKGSDVNAQDKHRSTPLHIAASSKANKTIRILIGKDDININAQDKNGATPLHIAASRKWKEIIWLIKKGADVNRQDNDGSTPLHIAACNSVKSAVQILLEEGANVDMQDENGSTPLHIAAYKGKDNILRLLLKGGASINIKDKNGSTPLNIAVSRHAKEIIEILVKRGDNVNF